MKSFKAFFILFLLILLVYVTNITSMPDSIILIKGESLQVNLAFGLVMEENNKYNIMQTSSTSTDVKKVETSTVKISLFNLFKVKEIEVNTIPNTTVIPLGNTSGLKLYTSGVLVVGLTQIEGQKPYINSGIKEGDMIISINENVITCTSELIECVEKSKGENLNITYLRDGAKHTAIIETVKTEDNEYKLGLWVRDGAAGIGTISFYEPSTGNFAALGHGIVDIDTEKLITISTGELVTTSVLAITKGEEGTPGEIKGTISNGKKIGEVLKNTSFGIYGKITNTGALNISSENQLQVALRDEIKQGAAKIILTIENNTRKEYNIKIKKIYKNNNENNKSMLIEVTDEKLLELTGGIIQGMSGAPIIQNGKFIGAVTHVLISDPTQGYAVFGDLMIKEMREVK